jgi:hypothetical protein
MSGYPKEFYEMRKKLIKYPCKCDVCGHVCPAYVPALAEGIVLHHIDGDIDNNKRENLLKACEFKCYPLIHYKKGLYYDSISLKTANKIREYRLKLLHRDNKFVEKNPPMVL